MAQITVSIQGLDEAVQKLGKFPAIMAPHLRIAAQTGAFKVEREAKLLTPVDTGRLRNSIATSLGIGGISAIVQTNVFYAIFVHEGTKFMKGRPFMQQAVDVSLSTIQEAFNSEIAAAIGEIT